MTGSSAVATASDARLIARARLADASAFSALFDRHGPAMWALAEILSTRPDPLVAATRRVAYGAVRRVRGPSVWMRGYLLQLTWRIDSGDGTGQTATPESSRLECAMPFRDHRLSDRQVTVADAFVGLAPAWQAVLWHHEVERESDEVVAAVVGVSANGVRTLVGSARDRNSARSRRDVPLFLDPVTSVTGARWCISGVSCGAEFR